MSTATAPLPPSPAAGPEPTAAPVNVDVERLLVGGRTKCPIYDDRGVFLLAADTVITADLKRRLRDRGIMKLALQEADLANTTLAGTSASDVAESLGSSVQIDPEVVARLDAVIDAGVLRVNNSGLSVRDQLVVHGRKGYDPDVHETLVRKHTALCETMDEMLKDALRGRPIGGDAVASVAATYLSGLVSDVDSSLSLATAVSDDRTLADHALKTTLLAMALGVEMGFDADNVRQLGAIGLVQDWGMIRVPRAVRESSEPLNEVDVNEIQKHPIYVLDLLAHVGGLPRSAGIVAYQVHERPDGSGYPRGRSGNKIHPFARVLHVADAFVAMTSPRPYRPALMPYGALECLLRQASLRRVDSDVVRALLQVQSLFPIGSYVQLSDGSTAQVLRRNGSKYMKPIVRVTHLPDGEPTHPTDDAQVIDLSQATVTVNHAIPSPSRQEIAFTSDRLESVTQR